MATLPNIMISELDYDRLEKLLDSIADNDFPGKAALEAELERAEICAAAAMPDDVVTMNSTVRFRVSATGETFNLSLVYPKDMDDSGTKVSILAPVGSALLGLRQGDSIAWPKPDGTEMQLSIETILYQPERAGEYHR